LPDLVQALARDNGLLRWTQSLLRVSRQGIHDLFARQDRDELPESMVEFVMTVPVAQSQADATSALSQVSKLIGRLRDKYSLPGWSIAAGPAFAAALAVGAAWLLTPESATQMTPALQAALEQTVTGKSASLPSFKVGSTYWSDTENGWCRMFDVTRRTDRTYAIACRSGEGQWRVVLQTPPGRVGAGVGVLAADPRQALDRYIAGSTGGPTLETPQVREAIKSGWERLAGR
jgi:hypothetical protein